MNNDNNQSNWREFSALCFLSTETVFFCLFFSFELLIFPNPLSLSSLESLSHPLHARFEEGFAAPLVAVVSDLLLAIQVLQSRSVTGLGLARLVKTDSGVGDWRVPLITESRSGFFLLYVEFAFTVIQSSNWRQRMKLNRLDHSLLLSPRSLSYEFSWI